MVSKAVISVVNDALKHQTLQVTVNDDSDPRDRVTHVQPYGVSFVPAIGSEGLLLSVKGDPTNSYLLCPLTPSKRPTGSGPETGGLYRDGVFLVYLDANNQVHIGSNNATHAMVLGDQLQSILGAVTVPTAMGPSGTPVNAANFPNFLSAKHKVAE